MRPFTILLIGQAISIFGSVLTGFALAVWAYHESGNSAMVYVGISIANSLPIFLLGPIAGAAADRWNRKKIILTSQVAAISMTAILTVLYYSGVLEVWHIIALVALNSVFTAFLLPTVAATVPLMVPKGLLTRANGSIALAFGIIELLSPLVSGTLYKEFGLMSVFAIDLVTFSIGIMAIIITFIPQPPKTTEAAHELEKESFIESMLYGLRYLKETPSMLQLILFFCIVAACIRAIGLMVQPMVLGFADAQELGHVMTIAGLGVLLGSLLLIPFRDSERHMPIIFGTTVVIAVAAFFTPMTTHIYFLAIGGFVLMACFPMLDTNIRTLFQRKIDPSLLGRIIGARNFVLGIFQTSIILTCGLLADKVFEPAMKVEGNVPSIIHDIYGVGTGRGIAVLISCIGVALLFVIIAFFTNKTLRRIDIDLQDIDVDLPITEASQQHNTMTSIKKTSVKTTASSANNHQHAPPQASCA